MLLFLNLILLGSIVTKTVADRYFYPSGENFYGGNSLKGGRGGRGGSSGEPGEGGAGAGPWAGQGGAGGIGGGGGGNIPIGRAPSHEFIYGGMEYPASRHTDFSTEGGYEKYKDPKNALVEKSKINLYGPRAANIVEIVDQIHSTSKA